LEEEKGIKGDGEYYANGILDISQPHRPPRPVAGITNSVTLARERNIPTDCCRDSFTFLWVFLCVVFIVCNVSIIVCVALCAVFCLSWCDILCDMCIFVLCVIVVLLPMDKNPFAVKLNNNNNEI
jgi:hypothetical protein